MSERTRASSSGTDQVRTLVSFGDRGDQLIWQSIGDRVMGGISDGSMIVSDGGYGEFSGTVRLDNGGGFASVKADLPKLDVSGYQGVELRVLGDGRTYKVGLRTSTDRQSVVYQHGFVPETEQWGRVQLLFKDFIPTWRGRSINDAPPLDLHNLRSVSLFVSERQAGTFSLKTESWVLF